MDQCIDIYTDGSCPGRRGPGGWAAILRINGQERELFGHEPKATSNRMELQAAIEALKAIDGPSRVRLYTDSLYLKYGASRWIKIWRKNGWRDRNGEFLKNKDLWQAIDEAAQGHEVRWSWVKGHSGHPENERCDRLARKAARVAQVTDPVAPFGFEEPCPALTAQDPGEGPAPDSLWPCPSGL